MKILWFALTPCGATEKIAPDIHVAGWLSSLERQIKLNNEINLSVCFYYNGEVSPFEYNSVNYYPINRGPNNNRLNKFKNRLNLFNPNYDRPLINKLLEVIENVQPDIIHIHGSEENFGLVQDKTKQQVIISIQGLLNPVLEKYFSGIPMSCAVKYESLISKILLDSYKNQFILFSKWALREKSILKNAKYIIGRTNWDRRISRILAPKSKYYIGNEIMRDSFYNNHWDKLTYNKKIKVVTTMSGGLFKGIESVLKTATILTAYKFDFEWIIIGQSETDNYPQMIKRWLKQEYIENGIFLCGRKNEFEVVKILSESDIYCQVSHIENSPDRKSVV